MFNEGSSPISDTKETKHKELRVDTTAQQMSITPAAGRRIRVTGVWASQMVGVSLTATERATLSFGTGGISDLNKIIASYRLTKGDDTQGVAMTNINVVGQINETVTLTNVTFSGGNVVTRTVIFYNEE